VRFHIQQESDIPASTQLYNQICFAIAARHYPPGHRLPSTRQLAMQTGLHRNTISKVYRQLETDGVVEAMAGFWLPEGFKDIAAYIVVLLMLVLQPNGLFGEKLRKKV